MNIQVAIIEFFVKASLKKSQNCFGRWAPQPHPLSQCLIIPLSWCPSVTWGGDEEMHKAGGRRNAQFLGQADTRTDTSSYRGGADLKNMNA